MPVIRDLLGFSRFYEIQPDDPNEKKKKNTRNHPAWLGVRFIYYLG